MKRFFKELIGWLAVAFTFICYLVHKVYSLPVFWDVFPIYKSWLLSDRATINGVLLTFITLVGLFSFTWYLVLMSLYLAIRMLWTWKQMSK
jgi:hypothetical protein